MNQALVDRIVKSVLYEGYLLYPYRPTSIKNQRARFTFGRIYPQNTDEPSVMQTECLSRQFSPLRVTIRFLQPLEPENDTGWQPAVERSVIFHITQPGKIQRPFYFDPLDGLVEIEVLRCPEGGFKTTVRLHNLTPLPPTGRLDEEQILSRTFASTHTILQLEHGEFISPLEPASSAHCRNIGTWPVLVGSESKGECDTILSSPIILSDYPAVAPESTGDFFDGTEIDEMLTLRIQTMTEDEKQQMRQVDEHARRLLERVEATPETDRLTLHGVLRSQPPASVEVAGIRLNRGSRVRIRPKARADAMDIILAGKTAEVEAVEQDAEGKYHLALVVSDDPGKDLGLLRQPGHRFFYGADEVEPITGEES